MVPWASQVEECGGQAPEKLTGGAIQMREPTLRETGFVVSAARPTRKKPISKMTYTSIGPGGSRLGKSADNTRHYLEGQSVPRQCGSC